MAVRFTDPVQQREYQRLSEAVAQHREQANPAQLSERAAALEAESGEAGFWDRAEQARKVLQELEAVRGRLAEVQRLSQQVEDIALLLEMAQDEPRDADTLAASEVEAQSVLNELSQAMHAIDQAKLFSGPHDNLNVLMEINSGAGGTESQDWVSMLMRMYLRWAEQNGYQAELLSELRGEEAGYKNVGLRIAGPQAYGHLRSENGVHRLVRISPFDSNARRHTSFASVFSLPEIADDDSEIEIPDKDMKVDVYRASGAGGQHVNKTESAIRITHIPTGIVVTCQNERSQHKNRATAMSMLRAKLLQRRMQEKADEVSTMSAGKQDVAFGSQIRSYVLHPYKLVKDHRTDCEVHDAEKVLDGYLEPFIDAYLRSAT